MFDASTLEVFIASTGDLMEERQAAEDVVREWNSRNGKDRQIMLKPLRWEKDFTPELGAGGPQGIINKQLLDGADILIGIFGKRLGTPTQAEISGTAEEVKRFKEAGKPVLLYFSDKPFSLSQIDTKELEAVKNFRKEIGGLSSTFVST